MAARQKNAKILEINLISAQNLFDTPSAKAVIKGTRTYVVAHIDETRKLVSRVDRFGGANPTWNDKFIFVVEEGFLPSRPYSCVVFEIHRVRKWAFWKRDRKIGAAHVLLENLMKEENADGGGIQGKFFAYNILDRRCVPRGILNIGAVSLDCVFRGDVPSFFGSALGVDHRRLIGSRDWSEASPADQEKEALLEKTFDDPTLLC